MFFVFPEREKDSKGSIVGFGWWTQGGRWQNQGKKRLSIMCLLVLSFFLSFYLRYHSPDSKGMVHSRAFLLSCPQSCAY